MKGMTIAFVLSALAVACTCLPQGTRERPAKITAADATRRQREDEALSHHHEPTSSGESKRLRRSLKGISEAIHGAASTSKLVAIPISLSAKTLSGKKAGSAAAAAAAAAGAGGLLGHLHSAVPALVGVKAAKVALPIVKPVVAKVHLAGSVLGAKAHFASKFISHKLSKF